MSAHLVSSRERERLATPPQAALVLDQTCRARLILSDFSQIFEPISEMHSPKTCRILDGDRKLRSMKGEVGGAKTQDQCCCVGFNKTLCARQNSSLQTYLGRQGSTSAITRCVLHSHASAQGVNLSQSRSRKEEGRSSRKIAGVVGIGTSLQIKIAAFGRITDRHTMSGAALAVALSMGFGSEIDR